MGRFWRHALALGLALAGAGAAQAHWGEPRPNLPPLRSYAVGEVTPPDWAEPPPADTFARNYPAEAKAQGLSGEAVIRCQVRVTGRLAGCVVVSETPVGAGFGPASIAAASSFRMTPLTVDGEPVEGGEVTIPVAWRPNP